MPGLHLYHEIPVDTTVALPSDATLVFLYYDTCETVTVVGGTITFSVDAYAMTGTSHVQTVRSPCPHTVTLQGRGDMAGTLLRQGSPLELSLSTQPTFVIVGPRADDIVSVRVSQGDTTVPEAPLEGRRFRWPVGTPALTTDTAYALILVPSGIGAFPLTTTFKTPAATISPTRAALTILKVE